MDSWWEGDTPGALTAVGAARDVLRSAWLGIKATTAAALVLQALGLAIVLGYYRWQVAADLLNGVGAVKAEWGYLYSMLSTALFGGLIPFLVLCRAGAIEPNRVSRELVFYLAFWGWKGAEIDAFYRAQAWLFGHGASLGVIVSKTAFDQFVYNPLWGAPTQTLFFLWKDAGFSLAGVRRRLHQRSLLARVAVVLFSTWVVWIPAVAVVYALPSALQVPLFNLVLCFWCLLLSFVSRRASAAPLPT